MMRSRAFQTKWSWVGILTLMGLLSPVGYALGQSTRTIPRLSSGGLTAVARPASTSGTPSPAPSPQPTPSPSVPTCSGATDLGYSIQDGQHIYKVEGFGPPGPHRAHAFLEESGEAVKDKSLLQELAFGAWTKEMIVDRHDPRRTIAQVVAALSASNNLEGWEDVTDVLARATVESIKAVATGGTSLNTAAQDLTLGVVEHQLTNPKVALAHWAHAGLLESLNDYGQMEQHWPSTGTTLFQLSELEKVKSLYTEANMQFSVSEALVGAIAPTTWQDEFANYISSAVSELKPSLPSSATFLTLDDVLKLEDLVAAAGKSFNAYKQSLDLAQRVAAGDQQEISAWAAQAANACGQAGGTGSSAGQTTPFPYVEQLPTGDYELRLSQTQQEAVQKFLNTHPGLQLITAHPGGLTADWLKHVRGYMDSGEMQFPYAAWRDFNNDGFQDLALVFASKTPINSWGWRQWWIVVFEGTASGQLKPVVVTDSERGSCFDGMFYDRNTNVTAFACFNVATGTFRWDGKQFVVRHMVGD